MLYRSFATAFILVGLSSADAVAGPSASASLNNVRIELVDLNLLDGISPTISFSEELSPIYPASVRTFGEDSPTADYSRAVGPIATNLYRDANSSGYALVASISGGDPYSQTSQWSASATAIGTGFVDGSTAELLLVGGPVTLSPFTQVTITGSVSAEVVATGPADNAVAQALAAFTFNGISTSDEATKWLRTLGNYSEIGDNTLAITWENNSNLPIGGTVGYGIFVQIYTDVTAVPENSKTVSLVSGMLILAIYLNLAKIRMLTTSNPRRAAA